MIFHVIYQADFDMTKIQSHGIDRFFRASFRRFSSGAFHMVFFRVRHAPISKFHRLTHMSERYNDLLSVYAITILHTIT